MHLDSLCSFYTLCRNNLAISSTVTIICIEIKCALLDTKSTTVIIVLQLKDLGSFTMKIILRVSYLDSGTGIG